MSGNRQRFQFNVTQVLICKVYVYSTSVGENDMDDISVEIYSFLVIILFFKCLRDRIIMSFVLKTTIFTGFQFNCRHFQPNIF